MIDYQRLINNMLKCFIAIILLFLYSSASIAVSRNQECSVYFASALFSIREKSFNSDIAAHMEKGHRYTLFLPQRDGFEFNNLDRTLAKHLDPKEVTKAEQLIIYYLDMGYFIPKSHVLVAVLDEDLDPGVMVEITYANLLKKHVIGLRTDVRSPYGQTPDVGAHFFSLFQLGDYIYFDNKVESAEEIDQALEEISKMIHKKIETYSQKGFCSSLSIGEMANNPAVKNILRGADLLFGNMTLEDIKSPSGIDIIVKRYLAHQQELEKIYPSVRLGAVPQ